MHSGLSSENGESTRMILEAEAFEKQTRLVEWNSDVLLQLLKKVVAHRNCTTTSEQIDTPLHFGDQSNPFDEVKDVIELLPDATTYSAANV